MATRYACIALALLLPLTPPVSGQWVQTNGPYGGHVACLAVSPNGPDGVSLIAGTPYGGIFRSTDLGGSWIAGNAGFPGRDPITEWNVVSVAAGDAGVFAALNNIGLYLSTDHGSSWISRSPVPRPCAPTALGISGARLLAAFDEGVFLSTDAGSSWSPAGSGLPPVAVLVFTFNDGSVFAGTDGSGVFRSTNDGASWMAANSGLADARVKSLVANGTRVFAGTDRDGVFLSTDDGVSWTPTSLGTGDVNALLFDGTNLYAGTGGDGAFRSTDNGATWSAINSGLGYSTVRCLAVSGTRLFAGTPGGVFLSGNHGSQWRAATSGLWTGSIPSIAFGRQGLFAGSPGAGVFRSTDNGATWMHTALYGVTVNALGLRNGTLFAGTGDFWQSSPSGVFRSNDAGASWVPALSGLPPAAVLSLAVGDAEIFAGTFGYGVYRSTDHGSSWAAANAGISSAHVWSLAITGTAIFAGTFTGVFRSTDSGSSWTQVHDGGTRYLAVAGGTLFAGSGAGVFRSTDDGTSWTHVGPEETGAGALGVSGSLVFASFPGFENRLLLSTDYGNSWRAVHGGMGRIPVVSVAASGSQVFVGTEACGVWRRPLSEFDQYVVNPGFEDGTSPWRFYTDGAGVFSIFSPGYGGIAHAGLVTLTTEGSNVQLYQSGIPLSAQYLYRLRFRAYSSRGHDVSVSLHKHSAPYSSYGLSGHFVNLGRSWQQFEIEFVASGFPGSVDDGRLRISLGPYDASGDRYYFDDVELLKVRPAPIPDGPPWVKTYGGAGWDHAEAVRQTTDGGFVAAGMMTPFGSGSSDAWVMRLTPDGAIVWQNVYGGEGDEVARIVEQTPDGGFLVAGGSSTSGSWDFWAAKLDAGGVPEWQKTIGGSGFDNLYAARATSDGGFLLAGQTDSFEGLGGSDYWVVKLNADGAVAWQRTYSSRDDDVAYSVAEDAYGEYLVAGTTGNPGAWDIWVLKLMGEGTDVWEKRYALPGEEMPAAIEVTTDGGSIVAGWTDRNVGMESRDIWLLKLRTDGSVAWERTYGGNGWDQACAVTQTADGGYAVAGWTSSWGAGLFDVWFLGLDGRGSVLWQKTYGGPDDDYHPSSIQQTRGGGYIIAAGTLSFGAGSWDGWLLHLDSEGTAGVCPAAGASNATGMPTQAVVTPTYILAIGSPGLASSPGFSTSPAFATSGTVCPLPPVLANSGFETGTAPWMFYTDGVGTFSNDVPGRASDWAARVVITSPGANTQLYQSGLRLLPGNRYRLSFWARSPLGHDLSVSLHRHSTPYTSYGMRDWRVDLSAEWRKFTRLFETSGFSSTVDDGRLRFWFAPFGMAGDEFFIDDVELVWVGQAKEFAQGEVPGSFVLQQNYPNPFNPTTEFRFDLPEPATVSLIIYDLLGRRVAELANGSYETGCHTARWNASDNASGVYLARFSVTNQLGNVVYTRTNKLVLIK